VRIRRLCLFLPNQKYRICSIKCNRADDTGHTDGHTDRETNRRKETQTQPLTSAQDEHNSKRSLTKQISRWKGVHVLAYRSAGHEISRHSQQLPAGGWLAKGTQRQVGNPGDRSSHRHSLRPGFVRAAEKSVPAGGGRLSGIDYGLTILNSKP
jgi:hypothetical protein